LKTIHHVFDTTAPRDAVFTALTTTQGLSGWWTGIVKAEAGLALQCISPSPVISILTCRSLRLSHLPWCAENASAGMSRGHESP
jgi:hypothetical protein